jgi:hypothetical protein
MKRRSHFVVAACLVGWLLISSRDAAAEVKLPAVIDSHMVLQRDVPLPIRGWAEPGEAVTARLGEATASTKTDEKGNWRVTLPARYWRPARRRNEYGTLLDYCVVVTSSHRDCRTGRPTGGRAVLENSRLQRGGQQRRAGSGRIWAEDWSESMPSASALKSV